MSDIEFVPGLYAQRNDKAPDYVLCGLSYPTDSLEQHINWLREQASKGGKYINVSIKRSKAGKVYAALDTWEPKAKAEQPAPQAAPADDFDDSSIPF